LQADKLPPNCRVVESADAFLGFVAGINEKMAIRN
jgi:hypothetical protein